MWDLALSVSSHRERDDTPHVLLSQLYILHTSWRGEHSELGERKGVLLGQVGHLDARCAVLLIDSPLCVRSDSANGVLRIRPLSGEGSREGTPVNHPLNLLIEELLGALDSRRALIRLDRLVAALAS